MSSALLIRSLVSTTLFITLFSACSAYKGAYNLDCLLDGQGFSQKSVDSLLVDYLQTEHIPIRKNNRIKLLSSGREKFSDLLSEIRKAKQYVHLEYFNFRNDSISHELFRLLTQKQKEGLKVRILFDAFGNMSNNQPLKRRHLDSLRTLGLDIVKYDPIRFPWINHIASRDHRKIVIIDGKVAYLGGMNVADYYITGLDKIGPWRDMHSRVEGEAVQDIQTIFSRMWKKATGEEIEEIMNSTITGSDTISLAVVDRSPRIQPDALKESIAVSIAGAQKQVNIVNPYFVPTRRVMKAIKRAISNGVQVNIMVSEKSDIPFTPEAMKYKLRKLAQKGAQVYLYQNGFHHAKVMTIDGKLSTIGSANLNSRSLRYDYETNLFIFDQNVTKQIDSIYTIDQEKSIMLDDVYWQKRSIWKKILGWFANLFTPFL